MKNKNRNDQIQEYNNLYSSSDLIEIKNIINKDGLLKKIEYATYRLKPIRNICSHIGMADLPADWFIYTLDILIYFSDSIDREDISALLMKLQLFSRYDAFGFDEYSREEYKTFSRPHSISELDYRFHYFEKCTIECWKNICKIEKVYIEPINNCSDVFSIVHCSFKNDYQKNAIIDSIFEGYRKKKILFASVFTQRYKDALYHSYPFHPSFFQCLYAMGLSNNTILEICNDTIASVESSEDNQGSLIMLSDIDFNHPELDLYFKRYFYLNSQCNSSLGWYYIRNNFLSTESPALQMFARDLKVDSLLVSQITKSIVLNTVMKYPFLDGKVTEERFINYNTYCNKYGFDTTIRDVCIDPKNKNIRQSEIILSNLNLLMGDFLIKSQSDKWLIKKRLQG